MVHSTQLPEVDAPAGHRRRRRWPGRVLLVSLVLLLVGSVFLALSHAGSLGSSGPSAAPKSSAPAYQPLLPGAPVLQTPTRAPAATVSPLGYDVSHPQCGSPLPAGGGFGIVGVTGGRLLSSNQCASEQFAWAAAKSARAVYVNTGYPGTGDPVAYGRRVIADAISRERTAGSSGTTMWWLDVETMNTWNGTPQQNATVLDAMAATLQQLGARVGIYSTPDMWGEIVGFWSPGLPTWYATGPGSEADAAAACDDSFAGSPTAIVQWIASTPSGTFDHDLICPAFRTRAGDILDIR
jgi:hypothetical protein